MFQLSSSELYVKVISLTTGQSTVAYSDGEREPNYELQWEYLLMESDSHANGILDEIIIPDDQLDRYNALKMELYGEENDIVGW